MYAPIENYGVIGDLHTVALVGNNGSIDWFCYPRFDSPSVFAAVLDDAKGGRFVIGPDVDNVTCRQLYLPDTNILITRFMTEEGVSEVMDFMPPGPADEGYHGRLIRIAKVVRGTMSLKLQCTPAFDYGRADHTVEVRDNRAVFQSDGLGCMLKVSQSGHRNVVSVRPDGNGGVVASGTLRENSVLAAVFQGVDDRGIDCDCPEVEGCLELLEDTERYWHQWLRQSRYSGRWRERVDRSALMLKLLCYEPTGAIVAAPTCSLPENIGGGRNWDYRYTWIRDASFSLYGLMRLGFTYEAGRFMDWLKERCGDLKPDGSLQIMYGIRGEKNIPESTLDHWEGYRKSAPVRIGNAAADQIQLDIYGEMMDSVYLFNKYGTPIDSELWTNLSRLMEWVCDHWDQPDEGIWEVRGGRQHFVYSKLMCWVALDRGVRLAEKRSFPANRERWLKNRDAIYQQIMAEGFNRERNAFVQAFGSDTLDASNLLMPLVFFVSPTDPKMLSTLEAINCPPHEGGLVSDSLVYRYDVARTADGVAGEEGTFSMCTFWLVEALTRAGRLGNARFIFEKMLSYANHLGLYSEETGPRGESLGNFPQAFTHLGLISAAFNLDRKLGNKD